MSLILFDTILSSLFHVSSSCDFFNNEQRSTCSWVTRDELIFLSRFRINGGDCSGVSL